MPDQDSTTRIIPLTKGKFAVVDAADYERLNQWKWNAKHKKKNGLWYAVRTDNVNGRRFEIGMHRVIVDAPPGAYVDHRDCNGLNNCRSNLRICSNNQNQANRRKGSGHTSRFKGVSWAKTPQKWVAQIMKDGKRKGLGFFADEKDAALAYDAAAIEYWGEFARLNFGTEATEAQAKERILPDQARLYLASLRQADSALYDLWRKLPVDGDFAVALNDLQRRYIHPEIERLAGKGK